jgi:flagellar hook-length control protein FliK
LILLKIIFPHRGPSIAILNGAKRNHAPSDEVTVPSVASEVQNSVSVRSHLHGSRNGSGAGKQASTPFAELLDSAAPGDTPAQPQVHRDRTEPADASPAAKPADGNVKNAPVVKEEPVDDTKAGDAKNLQQASDGLTVSAASDTKTTPDLPATTTLPKDPPDNADAPKADAKPKSGSDDAAVIATPDSAPPATTAQPQTPIAPQLNPLAAATPHTEGDSEVEAPAALPAVAPQIGAKPEKSQGSDKAAAAVEDTDGAPAPAPVQASDDDKPAPVPDADGKPIANQAANAKPGQRLTPAIKPAQGNAQAAATPDSTEKDIAPADETASAPQIAEAGKQQPAKGDAAPAEAHHSFGELFSKLDANAPQAQSGSNDTTTTAKVDADASVAVGAAVTSNSAGNVASAAPTGSPAAIGAQPAAVPLPGLAFEIATQASNGKNQFEIRLDPPELGRIEVKLNVDRDGNVSTHLVADRSDTLDLLKRDSASLERALQDSGLKTSDSGLQFSLRQQDSSNDDTPAQNTTQIIIPEDDAAPLAALRQGYGRLLGLGGGLDIRV